MNTTAVLAGLSASTIMGGAVLLSAAFIGRSAETATRPPSRWASLRAAAARHRRQALVAMAAGVLVFVLTGWPVAGLATAAAVFGIPRVVSNRASVERIEKLEALELWTRRLADLLTASRALEQALEHSAARNVPPPIAGPVTRLARRVGAARLPTEEALRLFADELNDPVGDRIAAALILVARRRGSGAVVVLNRLAELVAKDVSDRREVEAARAEHRTSIRWIIGIFATFSAIAAFQKTYVAPFGTPLGQAVLAAVALFYAVGLWWLHRLGTAAPGHRFLGGSV
ncbi:type II secretion system F family protein [Thermoactinospora rubra]|uniref:type II secretion system F family protein n=1 Tax=Thermoactinospora rubra TaxID=1088767 RepID=UPI001301DDF6|nr:type II secretion system F family protein [Thermoactinospora rubra]